MKINLSKCTVFILTSSLYSFAWASENQSKTYELDMFSLISFGLAIAALVLSIFMSWLSWQFYAKSTEAADKTNETVVKIETLVAGIQTNITEIVQRAVGYWIKSGGGDGQVNQSKQEIYEKIDALEQSIQTAGTGDTANLLKEVSALKGQLDELGRGIRESQIKTLFPNIESDVQTVKSSQENTTSDSNEQSGILRINIMRPTKIATGSVKFTPSFNRAPTITTTLIDSPYDDESSEISAKPGTPGLRGCNVHLNSQTPLKTGEYVFEFLAKAH
ncbi:MAG: hypothetical protein ACRCV6_00845 [Formosimonas sp.]